MIMILKDIRFWAVVGILVLLGLWIFSNVSDFPFSPKPSLTAQENCVVMQEFGDPSEKIDIVFLGDNYDNLGDFITKTEDYVEKWPTLEPYNEFPDSFNFYRIEDFVDLGCTYDEAIICDNKKVKSAAKLCPHDHIAVLTDIYGNERLSSSLRSSAWLNIIHLNTEDDWLVFPHEIAHVAYDFADEYDYAGSITWDAPNCDSDTGACSKFSVIEDYGCYLGCSDMAHSRDEEKGIMRDYWHGSKRYGSYNEWYIENVLGGVVISGVGEGLQFSPVSVLIIEGSCSPESCNFEDFYKSAGYPDGENRLEDLQNGIYVKNGDYSSMIESTVRYTDFGDEGNVEIPDSFLFSFIVPFDEIDGEEEFILVRRTDGEDNVEDTIELEITADTDVTPEPDIKVKLRIYPTES